MGLYGQSTEVSGMILWVNDVAEFSEPVYCQIHAPKTGGTFIRTWLEENTVLRSRCPFNLHDSNGHWTWKDYSERVSDFPRRYESMTQKVRVSGMVRHPYDRFVSQFRHLFTLPYKYDRMYDVLSNSELLLRPQYDYYFLDGQQMGYWYHLGTGVDVPITQGIAVPTSNTRHYRHTHKDVSDRYGMKPLDTFDIPEWMKRMVQDLYAKDFETFGFNI